MGLPPVDTESVEVPAEMYGQHFKNEHPSHVRKAKYFLLIKEATTYIANILLVFKYENLFYRIFRSMHGR
jgi:hypothetical protein